MDRTVDHDKLRTASTYLNNLLLARGLLRNGEPVDFVKPSKESRAQIINLVHDLILREDRDNEQRERVSDTLRQLRSDDARKTHEIERLTAKSEESARMAAQAQAAERASNADVKKVEKAMKSLQDQANKLKVTLAQVKTQCTNDVRKRDLELARLKTHLQGQQRGNRVGMSAPSMTVRKTIVDPSIHDIGDPEYSLKQETTEFLTQLSQSLSDENDSLISLMRSALATMKDLLGLPANAKRHPDSAMGSMGGEDEMNTKHKSGNTMMQTLPTAYESLAADVESTLSHLKTVLTNPNFVSVEEVEEREEEIGRLREGWDHMEKRWRDVLFMMQGWLNRMNVGDTINIDDLRRGMGLVSPGRQANGELPAIADESILTVDTSESLSSPAPRLASAGRNSPKRKRDVLEPPALFDLRPSAASSRYEAASPPKYARSEEPIGNDGRAAGLLDPDDGDESEELEIPQLTIAEKLSAAQREAEEAAAAGVLAADKPSRRARVPVADVDGSADAERDSNALGKMAASPMGKRTKIRGRPRKRKSTLLPEELETLICADDD